MPSAEIVNLRDRPALPGGALVGTETVPADDGTADGLLTVARLSTAARVGVRLLADPVPLADVTGLEDALDGKADVGELPANLTADTLTLTKRDTAPAAPGAGKGRLWLAPGANGSWDLRIVTGATGFVTTVKAGIDPSLWTITPVWSGDFAPENLSAAAGHSWGIGEPSVVFGDSGDNPAYRIFLTGGFSVVPMIQIEQQNFAGEWEIQWTGSGDDLAAGVVLDAGVGILRRGKFRATLLNDTTAPDPAPVFSVEELTPP